MYMLAHENEQGILWGEKALLMARRLQAEDVIVHALNNMGSSYNQQGDYATGLPLMQESLQRSLTAGLVQDICRGYFNIGVQLQRQCRYRSALDHFERLETYATQVHAIIYTNEALCRQMWIEWSLGEWNWL